MKRIAIMGCPGSGKSTLARALGERLDLPVYHLDALFWQPGWIEGDYAIFTPKVQAILSQDEWIIDGGYRDADPDEVRFRNVDAFIFYNRPVWICLWRVLARVACYLGRTRPDMGEGCPEKVDWDFLRYIWTYAKQKRPELLATLRRNRTPVILLARGPVIEDLTEALNHAMPLGA